jgi:hypothetical protein
MKNFTDVIFMGSGDHSMWDIIYLKALLEHAIKILSALQQPSHPINAEHAEKDKSERQQDEKTLQDIVQSIVFGLLGKEYRVVRSATGA